MFSPNMVIGSRNIIGKLNFFSFYCLYALTFVSSQVSSNILFSAYYRFNIYYTNTILKMSMEEKNDVHCSYYVAIDLGAANVRFVVIKPCKNIGGKKEAFSQQVLNNTSEIKKLMPIFSIKEEGRRVFGLNLAEAPWNVVFEANYVHRQKYDGSSPSDDSSIGDINWYAELNSKGCYTLKDDVDHEIEISISQAEAIGIILARVYELAEKELAGKAAKEIHEKQNRNIALNAIIVVPSFSGQIHRRIVLQAAKIAGFASAELISQSTASAIAYRHEYIENDNLPNITEDVALISIGARTTEMSIFRLTSGQSPKLIATSGCTDFGGTTFTARLVQCFLDRISDPSNQLQDPVEQKNKRKQFTKMVWEECERAKLELECSHDTWLRFTIDDKPQKTHLTVNGFEKIVAKELERLSQMLDSLFSQHDGKISQVMFCGGASRMQWVQRWIEKTELPYVLSSAIAPEETAIRGTALKCAYLNYQANCPLSIGRAIIPDYTYTRINAKIYYGSQNPVLRWNLVNIGCQLPVQDVFQLNRFYQIDLRECKGNKKICIHSLSPTKDKEFYWAMDSSGLISLQMNRNVAIPLDAIKDAVGLLEEAEENAAIKQQIEYKQEQERRKFEDQAERDRQKQIMLEKRREQEQEKANAAKAEREQREEKEKAEKQLALLDDAIKTNVEGLVQNKESEKIGENSQRSTEQHAISESLVAVEFKWFGTICKEAFITGSWNHWNGGTRLERTGNGGYHAAIISLSPGFYGYKFNVDGTWLNDVYNNKNTATIQPNGVDVLVNTIVVKPPEPDTKQMPPSDVVQATPSPLKVVQKSDKECNNAQENGEEKGLSNTAVNGHEHQYQPKQLNKEADALPHQQNNLLRGKEELKKAKPKLSIQRQSELLRSLDERVSKCATRLKKQFGKIKLANEYWESRKNNFDNWEMLETMVKLAESIDLIDKLIDSSDKICEIIERDAGFFRHFEKGTGDGLYNNLVFKLALNDRVYPLPYIMAIFECFIRHINAGFLPKLCDRDKKRVEELVELVKPIKLMPEECEDAEIITL